MCLRGREIDASRAQSRVTRELLYGECGVLHSRDVMRYSVLQTGRGSTKLGNVQYVYNNNEHGQRHRSEYNNSEIR